MAYSYDPSKSEELKKDMQQKVIDLAENFKQNPQDIAEYLKFSSKFYNYSSRNSMLIYQQNQGARYCNSFKAFKDMGYSVNKGEHGMKILVPTMKTYLHVGDDLIPLSSATAEQKKAYKAHQIQSEQKLFFKVGTVFDITQTNCPKEDYPKYLDLGYASERHAEICEIIKRFCVQELNCPVYENDFKSVNLRGYYSPAENSISLSGMFDDTTKLSILTHETGHAMLHNENEMQRVKRPEAQVEFEADATSVMLHSYFGIENSASNLAHLSHCYKEMIANENITSKDVTASLERAHKAFKTVVDNINQELRPELMQTQKQEISKTVSSEPPSQITDIKNNISKVERHEYDDNYLKFNVSTESGDNLNGLFRLEANGSGETNKIVGIDNATNHPDVIKNWDYIEKQLANYTYSTRVIIQATPTQEMINDLLTAGNVKFENCYFSDIDFTGTPGKILQASECRFNNCKFSGCDLIGADLSKSVFTDCEIRNSNFHASNLSNSEIYYTRSFDSNFSCSDLSYGKMKHCSFNESEFSQINVKNSLFDSVYFRNATVKEPVKNIDKISVTMGGATPAEIANHKQQILKNLNSQNNNPDAQNFSYANTQNNSQTVQTPTPATSQQPILPSQLPDIGMGGMNFSM